MGTVKWLALVALSCVMTGCAERKIPNEAADNAGNIEARVGRDFVIMLPSNITTGYSWRLAGSLPDTLKLKGQDYKVPKQSKGRVGAGGVEEWTFTPLGKGTATLAFEYVRPWEKDTPPAKRQTNTIHIR